MQHWILWDNIKCPLYSRFCSCIFIIVIPNLMAESSSATSLWIGRLRCILTSSNSIRNSARRGSLASQRPTLLSAKNMWMIIPVLGNHPHNWFDSVLFQYHFNYFEVRCKKKQFSQCLIVWHIQAESLL